jgi:protein-S-isoprenylcysteine O-methyltransferase Ste14
LALALPGGLLWLWAAVVLVALGRGTPLPLDPPRRLVVAGPYRWIRNPMHVGLAGVLLGEALLFRSIPVLVFAAAVTVALVLWEGPREERELADRFGDRYAAYRGVVPGWVPRVEGRRRAVGRIDPGRTPGAGRPRPR